MFPQFDHVNVKKNKKQNEVTFVIKVNLKIECN